MAWRCMAEQATSCGILIQAPAPCARRLAGTCVQNRVFAVVPPACSQLTAATSLPTTGTHTCRSAARPISIAGARARRTPWTAVAMCRCPAVCLVLLASACGPLTVGHLWLLDGDGEERVNLLGSCLLRQALFLQGQGGGGGRRAAVCGCCGPAPSGSAHSFWPHPPLPRGWARRALPLPSCLFLLGLRRAVHGHVLLHVLHHPARSNAGAGSRA